jgi:hypothetical protein
MKLRGLLPNFHIHVSLRMKDRPSFLILQYMYLKGLCRPHCKQDPIYIFPEMRLRGLVPNFHIHVSVSDLYISTIDMNRSQIHEVGSAVSFLGICVFNFRYSVFAVQCCGSRSRYAIFDQKIRFFKTVN